MVADDVDAIVAALHALRKAADHVFVAGGIGPTHDDVTLQAVAQAAGVGLVVHAGLQERVHAYFGPDAPAEALRLARVPHGAQVGFGRLKLVPLLRVGEVTVLPGVPELMQVAFADAVGTHPYGPPFVRADLRLVIGEAAIAKLLDALAAAHPDVALGCYPSFVGASPQVRLSVQGRDPAAVERVKDAILATWPAAEVLHPA